MHKVGRAVTRPKRDWVETQRARNELAQGFAGLGVQIRQSFALISAETEADERQLRARRMALEMRRRALRNDQWLHAPGARAWVLSCRRSRPLK